MKKIVLFICIFLIKFSVSAQEILAGQLTGNGYFYDITPDTSLIGMHNYPSQSYNIDINGDGVNDFVITTCDCSGLGGGSPGTVITAENGNQIALAYVDSCFGFQGGYVGSHAMAYAFHVNDTINAQSNWIGSSANLAYYSWIMGSHSCYDSTFSSINSLYIGVRVFVQNDTTYGWIKVNGVTTRNITIQEFACSKSLNNIPENKTDNIVIFPNPASNKIHLFSSKTYKLTSVSVWDISGREIVFNADKQVQRNNDFTIDVEAWQKGIHFIKVKTEKSITTQKIIVE